MIRFPETVEAEWRASESVANAGAELSKRVHRGIEVDKALERLRVRHEADALFQAEMDAESTPALEESSLAEYLANPAAAPKDLIDGVMKEDGVCIVLGPSGSGKTSLALQMAHSLATGTKWLTRDVQTLAGGVGILSYDMDSSMIFNWLSNAPGLSADRVRAVNAYRQGNPLGVPAFRKELIDKWKGLEVIILDSFSAAFHGKDQNDAAHTMAFYRDLKLFALTEVGAKALIVIVHSTADNPSKARGSTVHKDTADTMVGVSIDSATQQRKVEVLKYRAALGQQEMSPVIVSAPDSVTHLVDIDPSAMQVASLPFPPELEAAAETYFPKAEATSAPDVSEDSEDPEGGPVL